MRDIVKIKWSCLFCFEKNFLGSFRVFVDSNMGVDEEIEIDR